MNTMTLELLRQLDGNFAVMLGGEDIGIVGKNVDPPSWFAKHSSRRTSGPGNLCVSKFYVDGFRTRKAAIAALVASGDRWRDAAMSRRILIDDAVICPRCASGATLTETCVVCSGGGCFTCAGSGSIRQCALCGMDIRRFQEVRREQSRQAEKPAEEVITLIADKRPITFDGQPIVRGMRVWLDAYIAGLVWATVIGAEFGLIEIEFTPEVHWDVCPTELFASYANALAVYEGKFPQSQGAM